MRETERRRPRVLVFGLRGFPSVQGGIEKHAEHLCPLLVEAGFSVTAVVRGRYQTYEGDEWRGVRFRKFWAPASIHLETASLRKSARY